MGGDTKTPMVLIVFLVGTLIGMVIGSAIEKIEVVKGMRVEAVKVGAAEWVVDPEGNVEFKWKTPKEAK